ncbi:DNA-3-methyladenine glycosylase [Streptomyces sp. TS71-3]|uniref:DNA-3-methyladenine glycosylase family protein n=1 Tax=Streptomyces sp. TS71-3 TaxID=2733862 RepID=UPI001B0042E8|nr:DNA-3-methyladenine glycosylase 2 family protein [Streptomyces sp. TS71-3]GHJ39268.1 DNA-3-methyladenine glycosylase [Streptomyces sp. TS71-3]
MTRRNAAAYRHLAAADPLLQELIERLGRPDPFGWAERHFGRSTYFESMVLHVVGQQISTAAAFAIHGRLAAAAGGRVTPEALLALDEQALRAVGLSRAKAGYLHDLARRQADGVIDLEHMSGVDDETALRDLTAVRGIGMWSAEMFLLHQLKRTDIFPAGDSGLRRAVGRAWRLPEPPSVEETRDRARPWAPYRSYAAGLLWTSLGSSPLPAPADGQGQAHPGPGGRDGGRPARKQRAGGRKRSRGA